MAHRICHWSSQSPSGFLSAIALRRMAGLEGVRHPGLRIPYGGLRVCTLSFLPHTNGYAFGVNRDELLSRPRGVAPRYFERSGVSAVYPSEPPGGTWIAANAYGQLFALLNWHSGDGRTFTAKQRSRGEIIPQIIFDSDFRAAATILVSPKLDGILPFRLIGIDPKHRVISEWHWDGRGLCRSALPWARKHWFSSSL